MEKQKRRDNRKTNNNRINHLLPTLEFIGALFFAIGLILIFIWILIKVYEVPKITNASEITCENLYWSNETEFYKQGCNEKKVSNEILKVKNGGGNIMPKTTKTTLKWNNRLYSVRIYEDRIRTMKKMGLSDTRILDLITINNMECGKYNGDCFNGNDVGAFQINKVHKEQYNKSHRLLKAKKYGELFVYQLNYANKLLDSYDKRFCGKHIFEQIGKTYTNKRHFECIGKSYNGHPKYKYAYVKLGWERRELIKSLIYK